MQTILTAIKWGTSIIPIPPVVKWKVQRVAWIAQAYTEIRGSAGTSHDILIPQFINS